MQIGAVAKAAGVSVKAVRHYEQLGLLGAVSRRGSYRCFSAEQVERVRMIKLAQGLGFRLRDLHWVASADWDEVRRRLHEQQHSTRAAIGRLQARLAALEQALDELASCPEIAIAPVAVGGCEIGRVSAAAPPA
jgi:MerR family transcriptional regulator, copper efflux regulator